MQGNRGSLTLSSEIREQVLKNQHSSTRVLPKMINWVFFSLNTISSSEHHKIQLSRSLCSICKDVDAAFESSPYKYMRLLIQESGRSLMKIKNSNGPRVEPWDTPLVTCLKLENAFRNFSTLASVA